MEQLSSGDPRRQDVTVLVPQPVTGGAAGYPSDLSPVYRGYDANSDADSHSLILEYWQILMRHKLALCLFAFAGAFLALLIAIPTTPVYRVRASLEVLSMNQDFMNTKQTSPTANNDESYETSEEETQVKILESEALMDRVLTKFDPGLVYVRHNPRIASSGWRKLLHLREPVSISEREELLLGMADSLKVRATPRTRLIELNVKSTDPHLAVEFTNTLVSEFIAQAIETRLKTTDKVGDWLTRELDEARTKLARSEAALQNYAGRSGLIFTDDQDSNIATEKLQQLQQQLTASIGDRVAKEARYTLARSSDPDSLPDVLSDAPLREAQANVADARRKVADLSAVFTPDFSKVKRAQAELATMKAAFEEERAAIVEGIKNDYTEALNKQNLLQAAYDQQAREVNGQDEKAIQYNILKREVDSSRQLYDTMLQQLEGSSIASALHASNIHVVDGATLPSRPIWPNYMVLGPLGLFSGLLLGLGFVILGERADRSIQQPGETQLWTNLPELGTIPSSSVDRAKKIGYRSPGMQPALGPGGMPAANAKKNRSRIELVTWDHKPGLMAEAFRAALTSILFVGDNGGAPKVLMLTSASPSDGKTTVVSNLGIAMAEIRPNVLIIDADMRRPRMHDVFKVPNERGLSDLLRADVFSEDLVCSMIYESEVPGLNILPSGPPTHAASNLLYSPNLVDLLEYCRKRYDLVLIDTPPLLQITDARVVGRLVDGVILVARADRTTRDAMIVASQRLNEDRARILGTILNDWNPRRSPQGYYGYSSNAYRYYNRSIDASNN